MKEIVTIQLGSCGCNLGYSFWEDICDEHGILPTGTWCGDHDLQLAKISCLFSPGPVGNYIPRSIFVDLDTSTLDSIRSSPFGRIFHPDNFIFSPSISSGSSNNYAKCFNTLGPSILEETYDTIRREAERCDWITSFQILHSIGGGTGSALNSLLLPILHDNFPKTLLTNFTVFPSAKLSDTVVEPYNAILSLPSLISSSNLTICLDNEAIYDICSKVLRLNRPLYSDVNLLMSKVISGMSASYRFPARNHLSWRVLQCLAPSPNLHFFIPGFVPLASRAAQPFTSVTVESVAGQVLQNGPSVLMASVNRNAGKYLSCGAMFRGCIVNDFNVNEVLCRFEQKNKSQFVDWMPYHFMKGITVTPPRGLRVSATFLANHTCVGQVFGRILDRYGKLFKKKAFLHWYTGEGMSLEDFKEAENSVRGVMKEYKAAEGKAPKGWKSPEDNEVMKKVLKEEKAVRVLEVVTLEPVFRVLPKWRRSVECVQVFSLQC